MTGKSLTIRPRNGEFLSIMYVYYVENEIYIKYTDYHAGVSDVDENGNEVPIVKQWYYVIDKIQQ